MLENNMVGLPKDWHQKVSIFKNFAILRFTIFIGFGITYFFTKSWWTYFITLAIYISSWYLELKAEKKRQELYEVLYEKSLAV